MVIGKSSRTKFGTDWSVDTVPRNKGWDLGSNEIDNFHQKLNETLEHYIKRAQRMTDLCNGKDELYDQPTSRFCRAIRGEVHRLSLTTAMGGIKEQQGRVRFEACIAIAQGMVIATSSKRVSARDSDSDTDSDTSSDEDRDRRTEDKKRKDKKTRKDKKKRKDRAKEYGRDLGSEIKVVMGYNDQLEEIRKEKEKIQQEKEEAQKE